MKKRKTQTEILKEIAFFGRLNKLQKQKLERLGGSEWVRIMLDAAVLDGRFSREENVRRGLMHQARAMTRERDLLHDECVRLRTIIDTCVVSNKSPRQAREEAQRTKLAERLKGRVIRINPEEIGAPYWGEER